MERILIAHVDSLTQSLEVRNFLKHDNSLTPVCPPSCLFSRDRLPLPTHPRSKIAAFRNPELAAHEQGSSVQQRYNIA